MCRFAAGPLVEIDSMVPTRRRLALWVPVVLAALFLLRNDFWWWTDATRVLGLPIGLLYHVGLCGAISVVFALIVRSERAGS